MARLAKILLALFITASLNNVCESETTTETSTNNEELVQSETKDGKLEIVKRIKKVNPDGSYTIGYEADDGSFKIESRDVLGNIKGTYGFVDEGGDIKRVSYSSSNATEIFRKSTTVSSTETPSTTPLTVIQSIARRRSGSTTAKPSYSTVAPRVLLQRPSLPKASKDVSTSSPLQNSLHRFEDEKPVTEEASEIRTNILRRELPQNAQNFNAAEHVYSLQQSQGHGDLSDVYNSGATVTSRPLFTTVRSSGRPKQEVDVNTAAYSQPVEEVATSTESSVNQIPANRPQPTPEPLVAVRHPFQQGAILVPLSQLQNRIIPVDNMQDVYNARRQYSQPQFRERPKTFRPLPVQVDDNGYIREMPTPYPLPPPVKPVKEIIHNDVGDEIERIQPPVSTKDFQVLLNHLIMRQRRLEKISELTNPRLHPELYPQQPVRYQRVQPQYVQQRYVVRPQEAEARKAYTYYRPDDGQPRVGRQLAGNRQDDAEYLPPNVRETLLLRMLQLAMNPALPLDDEEEPQLSVATATTPQYRRAPVRNVQILGEEDDEPRPIIRSKRYNEEDMEYME